MIFLVYQSMLDNGELSIPVFKKMKLEQDCNDSDVLDSSNEESCYEYEVGVFLLFKNCKLLKTFQLFICTG